MKNTILSLVFLFNITCLFAQSAAPTLAPATPATVGISAERLAQVDQHIQGFVKDGSMPGGVFLIARQGKIVYNKAFGEQSLNSNNPYRTDDIFRLASMTKAFTTVAIMQLVEQGKLGLDDPIFYLIPAFTSSTVLKDYNAADTTFTTVPAKNKITIRHLLTHTSGITYGGFNPGKIEAIYTKMGATNFGLSSPDMTTAEMVQQIAQLPLIFEPGERYMYGLNMEILGHIVEIISQMPLNQYFKKNIFEPLGMNDTGFYLSADKHNRLVPIYTYNDKQEQIMADETDFGKFATYPTWADNNHYAGGGGTSGTAMDYAIFIQALLNNGTYNGKRILSRKSIEVMTSDQLLPQTLAGNGRNDGLGRTMGLGFGLTTEVGQATSYKSPGTYEWGGVFNTKYFIDPQEELIFVGMTQILPFTRHDFWEKLYAIIYGSLE